MTARTIRSVWISGGTVIDGTGTAGRRAEVHLEGDRIAAIQAPGSVAPEGAEVVDASYGLAVTAESLLSSFRPGCRRIPPTTW